jgi:hypothetical protein
VRKLGGTSRISAGSTARLYGSVFSRSLVAACVFGIENIRTQADPSVGKLYVVRTRLYADETERVRCLVKPSWDTCQLTLACNLNSKCREAKFA